MLFDWLITGQIVPQGRHQAFDIVEGAEWRKLLDSILAVNAALKMKVEDLRSRGAGGMVRLHEKGGKEPAMPCHHALAEAWRAYIAAAGIAEDRKGWLFSVPRAGTRPIRCPNSP